MDIFRRKTILTCVIIIFFIAALVIASQALAQEEKPKPKKEKLALKRFLDKIDFSCGIYEEYDDNIFFGPTKEDWDAKLTLTPSVYYEDYFGDVRVGLGHRAELTYYSRFPEWIHTQKTEAALAYTPSTDFSIAISDTHLHASQGEVMYKDIAERVLRLGYNVNSCIAETKFKLAPYLATKVQYEHDYVDFSDFIYRLYLDRNTDMAMVQQDFLLPYHWTLSGGFKCKVLDYAHDLADGKDYGGYEIYGGIEKKFLRLFIINGQVGYERRHYNEISVRGGKKRDGLTLRTSLKTTFSRFTTLKLSYSRGLADSSRTDFRQYRSDVLSGTVTHYITPKLIAFLSGSYELQSYKDKDMFRNVLRAGGRRAKLYSINSVLRYILTKNLSLEASYSYSKRDSDFQREGYTNNKYKAGCRVSF